MVTHPDTLDRLTTLIYAAALDGSKWTPFLSALSEAGGDICTHMFGFDAVAGGQVGVTLFSGYDPDFIAPYESYYHTKNAWIEGFMAHEAGTPVFSETMCARDVLTKTEWYNDWIKPQEDILGGGGVLLFNENRRMFALGGNIRRRDVERLEGPWMQLVARLTPHLQQSFEISRALVGSSLAAQAMVNIPEPLAAACLAVTRDLRIVYCNDVAETMLTTGQVIRRRLTNNRLAFAQAADQRHVEAAIAAIEQRDGRLPQVLKLHGPPSGQIVCRIARVMPESVRNNPFAAFFGHSETCFLMTLNGQPSRLADPAEALRLRFGLTPREADVVLALTRGLSPRDISDLNGNSIHTIRNQIKSAMQKIDVRRQIDLGRIVAGLDPSG